MSLKNKPEKKSGRWQRYKKSWDVEKEPEDVMGIETHPIISGEPYTLVGSYTSEASAEEKAKPFRKLGHKISIKPWRYGRFNVWKSDSVG